MVIKGKIKKGEYFDSVTLMIVAQKLNDMEGVFDAAVVMNTEENRSILEASSLLIPEFGKAKDSELLICVKAKDNTIAEKAMQQVDTILENVRHEISDTEDFLPKSLDTAMKSMPDANLVLISVAGKYAAQEAMKALKKGLHVMIFSDNVSLEDEIALKNYAREKNLFVMGPDCGTAIINDVPLAFANVVKKGNVGIVAASGTGLQEISSIISNKGAGISQAIGTGGRDVKKEVGGIMFLQALDALDHDKNTDVIVLVSKPPAKEVVEKIIEKVKQIKKPIIAIFLGSDDKTLKDTKIIPAKTLEQAALIAGKISKGEDWHSVDDYLRKRSINLVNEETVFDGVQNFSEKQKYLRGLFCGGTLCEEAQLILHDLIGDVYSNVTSQEQYLLNNPWKSKKNTLIDMGADEFTVGRPHPMIDFSLRNRRILQEAEDPEVAVILFDAVLGYGSNMKPAEELVPVIKKAYSLIPGGKIIFVCSVTGTNEDSQDKKQVIMKLKDVGVYVLESNAATSEFAGLIIKNLLHNSEKKENSHGNK